MQEKMTGNQYRTTIVCVDDYQDKVLTGRLSNPYLDGPAPFHGLMQFVLEMETLLDNMRFPQSFTESRTFAPVTQSGQIIAEDAAPEGKLATFSIKIIFRQNSSWQGSIIWLNTGQEESFRSLLELALLMNSALQAEL